MRALAIVGVLCLGGVAWSRPPVPPPGEVIPANGAVVGRNTSIWLFGSGSVELIDPSGAAVVLSTTLITTPLGRGFVKLTPTTELTPGEYRLAGYVADTTFTVTAEADTTPPAAPQVDFTTTGRIGSAVSTVTVTAPAAIDSFLVVMGEPQIWQPPSVHGAGAMGSATVLDLHPGPHTLKVVQVDAAGNASEPTMLVVSVPKDRACSVAPVVPLSLLALALLRRRRSSWAP